MILYFLTIFNIALFAFTVWRLYERFSGNWRTVLANLPTPTLGLAGSYGVYAFNVQYVPPWVAAIMAAAYDVTYIGLAALDDLDDAQRKRAKRIARSAAWISFAQNAIAGAFHAVPDLTAAIQQWTVVQRVALYAFGSLLHAAQVWIAFHTADLTLHRPAAQAVQPNTGKRLSHRPASMQRRVVAAKAVRYPAPEPVQGALPDWDGAADQRADEIRRLRDVERLTFREIGLQMGMSKSSVNNIYNHGRAYRSRGKRNNA